MRIALPQRSSLGTMRWLLGFLVRRRWISGTMLSWSYRHKLQNFANTAGFSRQADRALRHDFSKLYSLRSRFLISLSMRKSAPTQVSACSGRWALICRQCLPVRSASLPAECASSASIWRETCPAMSMMVWSPARSLQIWSPVWRASCQRLCWCSV
jgi:hypothetical protein